MVCMQKAVQNKYFTKESTRKTFNLMVVKYLISNNY